MMIAGIERYAFMNLGGNTVIQYAIALFICVVAGFAIFVLRGWVIMYLARFVKNSHSLIDHSIVRVVHTVKPPYYWFVSFVFALQFLKIPEVFHSNIQKVFVIWTTLQAVVAFQIFIDYVIDAKVTASGKHPNAMVSGILSGIVKIALWLLAILFVLSNLGVNIVSLVAGFGIGGIAIALAAQNILGDLFSSIAIYFDRPFIIGDYIVVGQHSGTVQKIGIKTTRIRALTGEEISIPNKDIAGSRISNLKRIKERIDTLRIFVPTSTSSNMLEQIPKLLQESVEGVANARCKSAFLVGLDAHVFSFELVYGVADRDFDVFLVARQNIILNVVKLFAAHRIDIVAKK